MRILVIPELREKQITDLRMSRIENNLYKTINGIKVANLASWSVFAPKLKDDEGDLMTLLTRGYFALSQNPTFLAYDVYIGFLLREDFPEVDTIMFESPAAKEIYEARMNLDSLPEAKETLIIDGEMILETEIYKRAIDDNHGLREQNLS